MSMRLGTPFWCAWEPHVFELGEAAGTLASARIPAPALLGALPVTAPAVSCNSGGSLWLKPAGANPVGVSGHMGLDLLRGMCWCGDRRKE